MTTSNAVSRLFRPAVIAGLCVTSAAGAGVAGTQVATAGGAQAPSVVSTTEWAQFRADPAHTGAVVDPVLTSSALARLSLTWRLRESGSMAVSGGLLYLAQKGQLSAIRVSDGSVAWRTVLPGNAQPLTPAVADGKVVAGGLYYARGQWRGGVWGLDATTGRLLWQRQLPSLVTAPPTVIASSVLVSWSGGLSRLRLTNGSVRWASTLPMNGSPAVKGSLVVGGNTAVQPYDVHAVDLATGALRWSTPMGTFSTTVNPVIDAGAVYAGPIGSLTALATTTGSPTWTIAADGGKVGDRTNPPALADNRLVERDAKEVWGVNASTGAIAWRAAPNLGAYFTGNPIVVGGTTIGLVGPDPDSPHPLYGPEMRDVATGAKTGLFDLYGALDGERVNVTEVVAAEGHLFVSFLDGLGAPGTVELSPS